MVARIALTCSSWSRIPVTCGISRSRFPAPRLTRVVEVRVPAALPWTWSLAILTTAGNKTRYKPFVRRIRSGNHSTGLDTQPVIRGTRQKLNSPKSCFSRRDCSRLSSVFLQRTHFIGSLRFQDMGCENKTFLGQTFTSRVFSGVFASVFLASFLVHCVRPTAFQS